MTGTIAALVIASALGHGVAPDSTLFWVKCESSGEPAAVAGPYAGLTQLDPAKRADMVRRWAPQQGILGDEADPAQQIAYSLDLVVMDGWHAWPACGRWLKWADGSPIPQTIGVLR